MIDLAGCAGSGLGRDAVIAIRLHSITYPYVYRLDAIHRTSWIGTRRTISLAVEAWWAEFLRSRQPVLLVGASILMPAFFFLLLPVWRRKEPEYFWFGAWLLSATLLRAQNVSPETFLIQNGLVCSWTNVLATITITTTWVRLISELFRSRISLPVWIASGAAISLNAVTVVFVTAGGSVTRGVATPFSTGVFVCFSFIYYELAWRTSQSRERMAAIHLAIMTYLALNFSVYANNALRSGEANDVLGAFLRLVSLLLFTFAMAVLLNQRSSRLLIEQQRLSRELESAAEVQSQLLTSLPGTGDGWQIEPVYLPASEVGGDFYRIFPAEEGAILVVVGDVSGKGLRAAMTVSGLMCAMEAIETRQPGPFLTKLNAAASAYIKSGFATCCAAFIKQDGETVIANAGHPSPYCDGRELETEPGLPLGIEAGVEYPELVARGERFTFVSDGVVEAANATGELFGFDRTLDISGKSAQEIATTAKAWGQNDDITVVTVQRIASPEVRSSQ